DIFKWQCGNGEVARLVDDGFIQTNGKSARHQIDAIRVLWIVSVGVNARTDVPLARLVTVNGWVFRDHAINVVRLHVLQLREQTVHTDEAVVVKLEHVSDTWTVE